MQLTVSLDDRKWEQLCQAASIAPYREVGEVLNMVIGQLTQQKQYIENTQRTTEAKIKGDKNG